MRKPTLIFAAAALALTVGTPAYAGDSGDYDGDRRRHFHSRYYDGYGYGYRYPGYYYDRYYRYPYRSRIEGLPAAVPRPLPLVTRSAAPYFDYEHHDSGFLLF